MYVNVGGPPTVRVGLLEIAYKKSAGDLGPDFLAQIRNQGGRPGGPQFLKVRRRREENFTHRSHLYHGDLQLWHQAGVALRVAGLQLGKLEFATLLSEMYLWVGRDVRHTQGETDGKCRGGCHLGTLKGLRKNLARFLRSIKKSRAGDGPIS